MLDKATDPWGIEIERVEVKDVRLPMSLQRAMAAEAEAAREARAKVKESSSFVYNITSNVFSCIKSTQDKISSSFTSRTKF